MKITVIASIIISFISFSRVTDAKETLRLGMLFSQKGVFDFSGLIPAIDIALETIEADETLPFTFTYTHNDSMVSARLLAITYTEICSRCTITRYHNS